MVPMKLIGYGQGSPDIRIWEFEADGKTCIVFQQRGGRTDRDTMSCERPVQYVYPVQ